MPTPTSPPLVVDLDGTLILTDSLQELALAQCKNSLWQALRIPAWLQQGKARLKQTLAERNPLDAASLPYHQELLQWLRAEQAQGRTLVLCTGADQRVAQAVAEHLGLFSAVIASDGQHNLTAARKAQALVQRYGAQGFDYVGNSRDDLPVWQQARQAIVANAAPAVQQAAQQQGNVARSFPAPARDARSLLRTLRPHQWLKNLLLFVPLLAAQQFGNGGAWGLLLLAFLSFSLCASAVYIGNDLLDLQSDRQHPRKCQRPFASGRIPVAWGVALAPLLLAASLGLGLLVGPAFLAWLAVYFALTCWYSLSLKRLVLLDCLTLAGLYTLRIVAGAAAVGLVLSHWLFGVSGFMFLSLSFLKRYTELHMLAQRGSGQASAHGRGYLAQDAPLVQALGVGAGYAAAVLLALYLDSNTARTMYRLPEAIFLAIAVLVYWISWLWLQAHRGQMHDDPVFFAIKDRTSLLCGLAFAATLALGMLGLPWA